VKAWLKELKVWLWIPICLLKMLLKCNKWDRIDHQVFKVVHLQVIHNIEALHQDKDNLEEDHLQEVQEIKVSNNQFYIEIFWILKYFNIFNYRATRFSSARSSRGTIRRTTVRRRSRRTIGKLRKRRTSSQ